MDILELAPGRGVGPLRLGDSLWAVLDTLRARKAEVPKIEVSWDPDVSRHNTSGSDSERPCVIAAIAAAASISVISLTSADGRTPQPQQ
jgi:hypothetical protein